jgi:hypothetical protein
MHLFFYDNLLQLDSITPVIDIIKDHKKIVLSSLNITHDYKNNKLIKYLKQNDIECLSFPPTSMTNKIKLCAIKFLLILPKNILLRFQGFWYRLDNRIFLDKNKFLNFLEEKKIKTISIPSDLTLNKKIFLYNLKSHYNLKIIEIEVGLRTLKTNPYSKFPQDFCDFYLASNKFLSFKHDEEFNRKTKFFGSSRYSNLWIKKLDKINQIFYTDNNTKINVALFLAPRILEENPTFLKDFEKIKNINLEIANKPKTILPFKCSDYYHDKFNANQLVNWADIIISHTSSILIEAILKKKKIFFCTFIQYSEKYAVLGNYIEDFNCIDTIQNFDQIIEYLENTGNEKINKEGVLLDKDDQLALCQLRGFDNDSEMINNYINFYENVIVE